jgi:hypothetical protein
VTRAVLATPGVAAVTDSTSAKASAFAMTMVSLPNPASKCSARRSWPMTESVVSASTKDSLSVNPLVFNVVLNPAKTSSTIAVVTHVKRGLRRPVAPTLTKSRAAWNPVHPGAASLAKTPNVRRGIVHVCRGLDLLCA